MHIELDVSLDYSLGCGQAHRWIKKGEVWEGVLGNKIVTLKETEGGFDCDGCSNRGTIERYFRTDDDFDSIIAEISSKDEIISKLTKEYRGLRILRQDKWECLATYILATNANVKRIAQMTETVCDTFGRDLGGRHAFPGPKNILDKAHLLPSCRLGYRECRLLELAKNAENGNIDLDYLSELDYPCLIKELNTIKGVGPKVADCVALFSFDFLNAFPVDARIEKAMSGLYGIRGNYGRISADAASKFGRYAGYAQEYLYHYQR